MIIEKDYAAQHSGQIYEKTRLGGGPDKIDIISSFLYAYRRDDRGLRAPFVVDFHAEGGQPIRVAVTSLAYAEPNRSDKLKIEGYIPRDDNPRYRIPNGNDLLFKGHFNVHTHEGEADILFQ